MNLVYEVVASLAYGAVGMMLMVLGYLLVDLLTPGRLHTLIWQNRNRNAAVLVATNMLGVAVIVATAIYVTEGHFVPGAAASAAYGAVGLLLMGLAFFVIDLLTPGKLGEIVTDDQPHPAVWVNSAAHLALALVLAAAIS